MSNPDGDDRIPLLYGGLSIAVKDIPTADQTLRVPAVFGRPSVTLAEFATNTLARVPFVSGHHGSAFATDIRSYERTGGGVAAALSAALGVGRSTAAALGAGSGAGAVHGVGVAV